MRNVLKLIFGLAVVLICNQETMAQYKFFTGGRVSFASQGNSESDAKESSFTVLPYIGYSVNSNIIVGLATGYQGRKITTSNDNYTSGGSFVINPFARYRVAPSEKMGLYGELGTNISLGNSKTFVGGNQQGDTANLTSIEVYVGPGLDYAFADRWVINALWGALSYRTTSIKDVDGSDNRFGLNLNPASLNFSLNYLF